MLTPPSLRMGDNVLHSLDLSSVDSEAASSRPPKENPVEGIKTGAGKARVGGGQPFRRQYGHCA